MSANNIRRDDLDLPESDSCEDSESQTPEWKHHQEDVDNARASQSPMDPTTAVTPSSVDHVEVKLRASNKTPVQKNAVKLYLHIGGLTADSKWVVAKKCAAYPFVKTLNLEADEDDDEDGGNDGDLWWVMEVGSKVRAKIDHNVQLNAIRDQKRVDFVANGIWAARFNTDEEYASILEKFQDYLFENTYGYEGNESNQVKVYGKDFIPESMMKTPMKAADEIREEHEDASSDCGAIQSLALGGLDDNRICTWDKKGMVQSIGDESSAPVLNWTDFQ
ncbi:hypothetical protein OROMI_032057 [Orobanche minor]